MKILSRLEITSSEYSDIVDDGIELVEKYVKPIFNKSWVISPELIFHICFNVMNGRKNQRNEFTVYPFPRDGFTSITYKIDDDGHIDDVIYRINAEFSQDDLKLLYTFLDDCKKIDLKKIEDGLLKVQKEASKIG